MKVKKIKSTREQSGGLYPLDAGSAEPGPSALPCGRAGRWQEVVCLTGRPVTAGNEAVK